MDRRYERPSQKTKRYATIIRRIYLAMFCLLYAFILWFAFQAQEVKASVALLDQPTYRSVKKEQDPQVVLAESVKVYLQGKNSPLADEAKVLVSQKHWKLLVAISAIESQYCKRKIAYNCWGIGGDSAYRHYGSYAEAILDANAFIEKWQARGKWLTLEDMNGTYNYPASKNWLAVTTKVYDELNAPPYDPAKVSEM